MFVYEKKLQYPVRIKNPNPALAKFIISQYGGPDGELGASLRYLSQRYSMPYPELKGLLFPFRVPVAVRIDVYEPLPVSRPKRVTSEPNTFKPDADNIAKLVMDGMNGAVWGDDSQVAEVHVVKWPRRRGIEPHMDIQVYRGWTDPAEEKK